MSPFEPLTFLSSGLTLAFAIAVVAGTLVLSFVAWRRSGFRRGTGLLELLRVLVAIAIGVTLNQPEWLVQYRPEEQPTLAVIYDDSESMETRDVEAAEAAANGLRATTRREWVAQMLETTAWQSIADTAQVLIEPLSSLSGAGREVTDLGSALSEALEQHGNLRGIVLFSDGDWNVGPSPTVAGTQLRMRRVPVYAVGVGSASRMPDVEIRSIDAPSFGVVGKPIRIPFSIRSALPRDYDVEVSLASSSGDEVRKTVQISARSTLEDEIVWQASETGEYTLTMNVPMHDLESREQNNTRSVPISIREEALRVLLVESVPRWEYRYLRNALSRDPGVDVSCLLFHPTLSKVGGGHDYIDAFPETLEQLSHYDVVVLGDVGIAEGQLTLEQCRLIRGLVEYQASGVVFLPGRRGHQVSLLSTELEDLYPVVLDELQPRGWGSRLPARFELTRAGRRSLLTQLAEDEQANARIWETLPGFQWYAPVLRAKAGSQVLAVHGGETNAAGRIPLIVTRPFGTGKILFMGTDGAWRWREGVEDRYHYRFWGQVARWMAYQRNMVDGESIRLFYSPDRPKVGDVVRFHANVMSVTGEPVQRGTVSLQAVAPSGRVETVKLSARSDEWGLFSESFTPQERGDYTLRVSCRESDSAVETSLTVEGVRRERIGEPARFEVLEEIAAITRGGVVRAGEVEQLLDEIAALPEPEPEQRRLRLWCHPLWAGALIFLLCVFWVGRKMIGVI